MFPSQMELGHGQAPPITVGVYPAHERRAADGGDGLWKCRTWGSSTPQRRKWRRLEERSV